MRNVVNDPKGLRTILINTNNIIIVQTIFPISRLIIYYSQRRFDHHWWSSSGTVSSLLARWHGDQIVPNMTESVTPSPLFIIGAIVLIQVASLIESTHLSVSLSTTFPLPVWHTVMSVCMVRHCRLVFYVCRPFSFLPSKTLLSFQLLSCAHLVLWQMFVWFYRCKTNRGELVYVVSLTSVFHFTF